MRRMYQEYSLYVFLPADFVFTQTKNMLISAFGVYAAAAVVVVLLLVRLGRDRKRRELAYQKQLEKEVERATAADQAKTHFLRSMSHDIRTPINIIMGMLEIIGRNPEDVTLVQSCREKAQTAARYLLALVNDVLTLNRPKQEALGKTPYCLTSELHEMLDISRAQAEIAGVALTVMDLTLEHERFTGDPLYMRQICQNIIGNAIKYNHPGGWVRCSFRESRDADGVCRLKFVCEDNGAGMSETFQRHMFEAFAQENSDKGSLFGGVGLGLAVVKKLVDERGGTIQVDSARGQGTRFRVVLPMMPGEAEPEAALPDAAASIAGRRLLVAEDNELNREIAVYLLQEAGAVVDQAADGKEAVEMFAASAPGTYDAVLMDVMMPELDGLSATRAIRGMDRPDAQLPIIAMTANLFDEDVAACLAAGMDAHIPKPLEAGRMIKTIAEWLERKKQ
jgi:signal transduction histidine kinase